MERDLTKAQEKALLSKHLSGDFGVMKGNHRSTLTMLIRKGYLIENKQYKQFEVTNKGRKYCDLYHLTM